MKTFIRSVKEINNSNIIMYTTEDGLTKIEVTFDGDTVWLSLDQMAKLFQRDKSTISRLSLIHIFQAEVKKVTEALGSDGRILLRSSGTEPLVRVMVEAADMETCEKYVDQVISVMKAQGHCI